jgi:hypothetical protein
MAIIQQAGTVVQYKNSAGAIRPGTLLQLHDPLHDTWDLVAWGSTGAAAFHSGIAMDDTQTANNTFKAISGSVPF